MKIKEQEESIQAQKKLWTEGGSLRHVFMRVYYAMYHYYCIRWYYLNMDRTGYLEDTPSNNLY